MSINYDLKKALSDVYKAGNAKSQQINESIFKLAERGPSVKDIPLTILTHAEAVVGIEAQLSTLNIHLARVALALESIDERQRREADQ